jgi:hypothetical protein
MDAAELIGRITKKSASARKREINKLATECIIAILRGKEVKQIDPRSVSALIKSTMLVNANTIKISIDQLEFIFMSKPVARLSLWDCQIELQRYKHRPIFKEISQ